MSSRLAWLASCSLSLGWITASGCATGGGPAASPAGAGTPAQAAPAASGDVEARIRALEREIAALKQAVSAKAETGAQASSGPQPPAPQAASAQGGSAAATDPQAETTAPDPPPKAAPPAEKPLLVWQVTPDITFKPGLRVQGRYVHDGSTNNNDLAIQRFRLKGSGEAWKAKYGVELKIDGTGRTGANPNAAVENAWLDYGVPDLIGRAGLYDVPFSRDALTSDSKLLFMDRSLIKDSLTSFGLSDNGIGVMARGRPLGGRLDWAVGVFNNDQFGGLGGSGKTTGWVMPVGRIAVDLLDPAPPGGYADYKASYIGKGRRLAIGANGAWLGNAESGLQEFNVYASGADLFFNWGPYTLQAEYDWFRLSGTVDRSSHGFYVQGGYLLEGLNRRLAELAPWFPDFEIAARYQGVDALNPTTLLANEDERRTSFGMNAYIHDHNLKVQSEASLRQLQDSADGMLYQVQLQLDF